MRKPTICICENKGADQLRGNQCLCSRFSERTIPLLLKSEISSLAGPVQKPHCWFGHEAAHLCTLRDVKIPVFPIICTIYCHIWALVDLLAHLSSTPVV